MSSISKMLRRTTFVLLAFATAAGASDTSDSFRIEFNHSAGNDGEIVFLMTTAEGDTHEIRTMVEKGDGENHVAKMVTRSFEEQMPEGYKAERDDWEDVLVKGRIGTDDFSLTLLSSSVEKLDIDIEKE